MNAGKTIIITGAAGFIGSCLTAHLNRKGVNNLVLVDDFSSEVKMLNLAGKAYSELVHRDDFFEWLKSQHAPMGIFHLGARTDTTEFDYSIFQKLNVDYSKKVWEYCAAKQVPLIYASSAATYGNGENGYSDDHAAVARLQPLNPYGRSKQEFDLWAIQQHDAPPHWYGLKFFNVYGPNEYHKQRMASVAYHAYNQIRETGSLKLFRSHHPGFKDGEQLRDFIYVKDVVGICDFLMNTLPESGIYNVGTGKADSFINLGKAVFESMGIEPRVDFIDIPRDIRNTYQYYTQAEMSKLVNAGYGLNMYGLGEGIRQYVQHYLSLGSYF